ncbi:EEF1A lysine methyltransferase 4 isoform X1 [Benincasa hispida]|uniref:EEF1A lysine methyltransferase 4 isoform X1 n=1 Tax=Benincasa hispida TaxID=102211 RepID=UPI001900BFBD|nr:EEF1A lysine methyltransferase 4 isoform X1 [Benincasa hispida]
MATETCTQAYGEPSYWDNRYSNESGPFDWYQKYHSLAPLINLYVSRHHRILAVGCGNSAFSEGMVDDGYVDVVNVDISSVVIEAMQKKYCNRPQLKYMTMDVRNMSAFEICSFDAVLDKGTLDSLLCGNNSRENATRMLEEVWRVLKENGVYILVNSVVTYGAPTYRLSLLKRSFSLIKLHVTEKYVSEKRTDPPKWDLLKPVPLDNDTSLLETVLGQNPDVHYIYICTKDSSLKPDQKHDVAVE